MSTLLIDNVAPRAAYTATAAQTVFAVPFVFFADSELRVYVNGTLQSSGYTPAGAGSNTDAGRQITFSSGRTVGDKVVITREIPIERISDFPTSGPLSISTLNTELDKIVSILQRLSDQFGRTIRLADGDNTAISAVIPNGTTRADKLIGFDANGNLQVTESYAALNANATSAASNATAAASSATAAAASATSAATSQSTASSAATTASGAATTASSAATTASTAATNASTSETNAAASASTASTAATTATTQASAASTSATNAAASATTASSAATTASSAATAAEAAWDSFDDRYLGAKASDPTLDNDGNALISGAFYFNTTDNKCRVWNGTTFVDAAPSVSGVTVAQISDASPYMRARIQAVDLFTYMSFR